MLMAFQNPPVNAGGEAQVVGVNDESAQAVSLAKHGILHVPGSTCCVNRYPRWSLTPRRTANRQRTLFPTMLSMKVPNFASCRYTTLSYAKAEKVVNAPQNPVAINSRQRSCSWSAVQVRT